MCSSTSRRRRQSATDAAFERGYAMVALLVAMSVMAVMLGAALPAWKTYVQREKEAELVFRGEQYARAITLFQRKYANAAPPNIDVLVNERFLRKKYKDPITNDDFQVLTAGSQVPGQESTPDTRTPAGMQQGLQQAQQQLGAARQAAGRAGGQPGPATGAGGLGIMGVTSKSSLKSFRLYRGRDTYNQWIFMGVQQTARAGGPGGAAGQTGTGRGDGRGGRGVQQPPGRGQPPQQPPQPPGRGRGFGGRIFDN